MWNYVWPLLLVVCSNVSYHIVAKSTPSAASRSTPAEAGRCTPPVFHKKTRGGTEAAPYRQIRTGPSPPPST